MNRMDRIKMKAKRKVMGLEQAITGLRYHPVNPVILSKDFARVCELTMMVNVDVD